MQRIRPYSSSRERYTPGPGTEHSAAALLPRGTWASITGIGPDPQWLRIQLPGLDAPVWVHRSAVKLIGSLTGIPHVTQ